MVKAASKLISRWPKCTFFDIPIEKKYRDDLFINNARLTFPLPGPGLCFQGFHSYTSLIQPFHGIVRSLSFTADTSTFMNIYITSTFPFTSIWKASCDAHQVFLSICRIGCLTNSSLHELNQARETTVFPFSRLFFHISC